MDDSGTWRPEDGCGLVRVLRRTALCADGVGATAALLGRQDVVAYVGVLAVALRAAAEFRERVTRR